MVFPSFSDFSDNTALSFADFSREALLQGKFVQDRFDSPGNVPQVTSGHGGDIIVQDGAPQICLLVYKP